MTPRPFRFGASVRQAEHHADWTGKARKVEDAGFSTLLVADHLVNLLSPFPALLAAAHATRTLRVGTLVLNNDFRHPVLMAREAATVDLLSEGRLELGLGAGHAASEYLSNGIRFEPWAMRAARLAEAVHVVKGLLSGETVTFEGEHYHLRDTQLYPTPVQRPHPPLLVGGNSRAVLTLAAQHATIVGFTGFGHTRAERVVLSGFTAEAAAERVRWVCEAAGERFGELELNVLVQAVVMTADRRAAAEEVTRRIPGLSVDQALDSPFLLLGTVDQIVEQLQERRECFGFSYYAVFEQAIDAIAPVVERLTGR